MIIFKVISAFFVLSGILIALFLWWDTRRHPQPMKIMNAVWPLTGLWSSWIGLWAYYKLGRNKAITTKTPTAANSMKGMGSMNRKMDMGMEMNMEMADKPAEKHTGWKPTALSTLHCGAGCTLADILGEWFVFFVPLYIGGSVIAGQWVLDYVLALIIGVFFQYAAIQPMQHLPAKKALTKALKADFFSLTAWQIGMYGWMAIVMFALFPHTPLPKNSWEYWFLMQIAMFTGFLTSFPVNRILIRKGIKHGM